MSKKTAKSKETKSEQKNSQPQKNSKKVSKKVALAIQGGGSHGAFSWGVIDYLLEDGRLDFEGASGTSAGGMNCLALCQGLAKGGKKGARETLLEFWKKNSEAAQQAGIAPTIFDKAKGDHGLMFNPAHLFMEQISKFMSPAQWNPHNKNVLEDLVKTFFDFNLISTYEDFKVFLCATNVRTSKLKFFTGKELSVQSALASACLPTLFHPVTIDGEDYWDGGFIGNPALFPLIYNCKTSDIITILLTPQKIRETPKTMPDIRWRLTELSLINTLTREMRAINFISKLIDDGIIKDPSIKRMHMHIIENPEVFHKLNHTSALNPDWEFLQFLFEEGRKTGKKWLEKNYDSIGVESTVNLEREFV